MSKDPALQNRLEEDTEHLREEIATIELISAHATGHELERMRRDQKELADTIDSKERQLQELTQANTSQWLSLLSMAMLLMLAAAMKGGVGI